ncbi:MAG: DegT/DnrJ/EryC1/StrS family aminotransferase [Lentisphaerae bacterium]|nr:DegT/DnrJ/EryC1/StrS family aminotransferase [Lentisphaerota bacterium]
MHAPIDRRSFLKTTTAAGAGLSRAASRLAPLLAAAAAPAPAAPGVAAPSAAKPALLGGAPVHTGGWSRWPQWREAWEDDLLKVYRSGKWFRGSDTRVEDFETAYAKLLGAKKCLATASGTTALMVALHVMDVDAGDEVIVSPYTFIATYNAILNAHALPVFADTDPATLNMDPATIESRITDRTRAIMPVHIFGMSCDMDPILAIAKARGFAVVEDACQAWLAEYKGRRCGTIGDLGCFSFQESKHLPAGEGGAVAGMSEALIDKCNSFHNCGRACGTNKGSGSFTRGNNCRMTQAQAVILLQQLGKLVEDTAVRRRNADYLGEQLRQIPGIQTMRLPEGSRPVWHLYPFRYGATEFAGLSRDAFMKALNAEGIPCSSVYREQYFDGLLDEAIASRGFKRLWSAQRLKAYRESLKDLRGNQQVCATTVALPQTLLLSDRAGVDHIVEAIRKIRVNAAALAKAS